MKIFFKLLFTFSVVLISSKYSFSVPLNGNYTIGSGGQYASINAAVTDLTAQGINGPVVFRIFTGSYNEQNIIQMVTGSTSANTITFESFTGNANDVIINFNPNVFRFQAATNVILHNLTLGNISLEGVCINIKINDNKFSNAGIVQAIDASVDLEIRNNSGLSGILLNSQALLFDDAFIAENDFFSNTGFISVSGSINLIMQDNRANQITCNFGINPLITRNLVYAHTSGFHSFEMFGCDSGLAYNNFIYCIAGGTEIMLKANNRLKFMHNSLSCKSSNDTTISIVDNTNITLKNNINVNYGNGYLISYHNNSILYSDYNFFHNASLQKLIFYNGVTYNNLPDFFAATGFDGNSCSGPISFVSQEDMHLAGASIGDPLLKGIPDPQVTIDIDGQSRNSVYPYMGADEADFPLPVELTSFTFAVNQNHVTLNWVTSSEINNSGFEVQRKSNSGSWLTLGFINGNGNSNSIHDYKFSDMNLESGIYDYRLKQIDNNGNFSFHLLQSEVEIGIPERFSLSQNYPNPFNPSTRIDFTIPKDGMSRITLFDITGKELKIILNEFTAAGYHSADVDAGNFPSGLYFYKLESGNESLVKKMTLLK